MDLKKIKQDLMLHYNQRIELHAHTRPASLCSEVTPWELVDTYKKMGYSGICITNHFLFSDNLSKEVYVNKYFDDFLQAQEYGNKVGIKVYLGAEIRFTENNNDYLIYGVNKPMLEEIYDTLTHGVENFRRNYIMQDSIFIQAHPMRDGIKEVPSELLDGVEAFNMHPVHNSRIALATLYAKEKKLSIITAGTDYHHPNRKHEGLAAIRTSLLPEDSFGLAQLLKKGDYLLDITGENIIL